MKTTPTATECRVVIVNDVLGTRDEFILPCSPDEAQDNCVILVKAGLALLCLEESDPLAVAMHVGKDEIIVRWHATGDVEDARRAYYTAQGWKGVHHKRYFNTCLHRLEWEAGIQRAEHFSLQTVRRTVSSVLWRTNPQAAQLGLGHTTTRVTAEYYVNAETAIDGDQGIMAAAVEKLPQPEAFTGKDNA